MDKNDHFYLGTISRKFSFKGEVVLQLNPDLESFPQDLKSVFVEIGQKRIPFFIEFTKQSKHNSYRLKFEDINTEDDAQNLVSRDVYVLRSEIDLDESFRIEDLIGYVAFDTNDEEIGEITDINTMTIQSIFEIQTPQAKVLVPVNEDWILDIDEEHQEITLDLPDGLLELNA